MNQRYCPDQTFSMALRETAVCSVATSNVTHGGKRVKPHTLYLIDPLGGNVRT
jgi:hypothetical protein